MSQTLVLGGPASTISSLGAVVTYGPSGFIVQYPNGGVISTFPVNGDRTFSTATTERNMGAVIEPIWFGGDDGGSTRVGNSVGPSFVGQVFVGNPSGGVSPGKGKENSSVAFTGVGGRTGINTEFGVVVVFLAGICLL